MIRIKRMFGYDPTANQKRITGDIDHRHLFGDILLYLKERKRICERLTEFKS